MGQKRSRQSTDNGGGRPVDALQTRVQGVLRTWIHNHDDPHSFERGYGFITPDVGAHAIFVHARSLRTAEGMAKGARVEYMQFFDKRQPPSQALVARDVVALDQRTWSQKRQRQELPSHVDGVDASSSAGQSLDQRLASFVVSQLRKHEERTTTQLATTLYTFCVEARAHVSAAGGMRRWLDSSLGRRIKVTCHPTGKDSVQLAHSSIGSNTNMAEQQAERDRQQRDRLAPARSDSGRQPNAAGPSAAPRGMQELRDRKLDSSLGEIVARASRKQAAGLQVRSFDEIMEEKRKQPKAATATGVLEEITADKELRFSGGVAASSNGSSSTSAKRLRAEPAASSSASGKRHVPGSRAAISGMAFLEQCGCDAALWAQVRKYNQARLLKLAEAGNEYEVGVWLETIRKSIAKAASAPEEKRYDDDGRGGQKLYTKAQFFKLYGSHAKWGAANRPLPPRAQPVAPASLRAGAGAPRTAVRY